MLGTPKSYKENTFMITTEIFVYYCAFNHSFTQNFFFLMKVIFIQGAFKKLIFQHFCGKFKDFSRISHNFLIFKDFSRLVWTMSKGLNAMPWLTTITSNTYSFLGKFAPLSKVKLDLPFNLVFSDVGAS